MSTWSSFLPLLTRTTAAGEGFNKYKASELHRESRLRHGNAAGVLEEEEISALLKESLVLLLKRGASYSFEPGSNELIYSLPGPNTRALLQRELASRYWTATLSWLWQARVFPTLLAIFKTIFGLFLLLSLSLVVLALLALLLASNGNRNGSSSSHGAFRRILFPVRFWYCPCPVQVGGGGLGAAQVARRATTTAATSGNEEMSLVEAIFSFVFGDGHHTAQAFASEEVEAMRAFIRSKPAGTRFRAYDFYPFLLHPPPLPPLSSSSANINAEHVFMSDIVWRFQANVVAADDGSRLEYVFPSLPPPPPNNRAQNNVAAPKMYRETRLVFSRASPTQQKLSLGLGVANFVLLALVALLSKSDEFTRRAVVRGGVLAGNALRAVNYTLPLLLLYALAFLFLPAARYFYIQTRNKEIDRGNESRESWRRRVQDLREAHKV